MAVPRRKLRLFRAAARAFAFVSPDRTVVYGPRTKWATLDGAVSIKNKVETPTIDAAALWRSLRSLPFLERLELTRVAFTPTSHSPLSILDFTRVKELCLYKVAGLGADVLSELIACCPCLRSQTHHANPWMDLYRRRRRCGTRGALAGLSTWQDTDDSVAALAGRGPDRSAVLIYIKTGTASTTRLSKRCRNSRT